MPELSSDIEAKQYQNIPNSHQNGHVIKLDDTDPNDPTSVKKTSSGKGYQVTMDWEIDEGEYAGRVVRYDNLSVGGNYIDKDTKEEKPLNLTKLCEFLSLTGVKWECTHCKSGKRGHKFYIGTGEDGLNKGTYYCPDCKNPKLKINYNTSDFLGARCGLSIGSKPQQGSDKEFNIVKGYLPLRTY